ncbi:MAG: hypothetical protein ACYTFK_12615 [Planctomycetota bacterium]|jgi:hypothetical protein
MKLYKQNVHEQAMLREWHEKKQLDKQRIGDVCFLVLSCAVALFGVYAFLTVLIAGVN